MQYQISRNGQTYGPYTREDLERYVGTGNVLPTDLAKSETMTEWQPVATILAGGAAAEPMGTLPSSFGSGAPAFGFGQAGFAAPEAAVYGAPAFPPAGAGAMNLSYPDPPKLAWGWVLLLDCFTLGFFQPFWNIYIASWLRKVQPNSTSLFYYIAVLILALLSGGLAIPTLLHPHGDHAAGGGMRLIFWVLMFGVKLAARFTYRSSLQAQYGYGGPENIGLDVNPVLVFFFGGLYLQSVLTTIAGMRTAVRMQQPRY